jgi:hypothetical protein
MVAYLNALDGYDDFADLRVRFHVTVRFHDLVQAAKYLVDAWLEASIG